MGAYAEYAVWGLYQNGDDLAYIPAQEQGGLTSLASDTVINLTAGYVYLVSYIFAGDPRENSYIQVLPYVNGQPRFRYSAASGNSAPDSNGITSVSATFLITETVEAGATLSVKLGTTAQNPVDTSGAVTIVPVWKNGL